MPVAVMAKKKSKKASPTPEDTPELPPVRCKFAYVFSEPLLLSISHPMFHVVLKAKYASWRGVFIL